MMLHGVVGSKADEEPPDLERTARSPTSESHGSRDSAQPARRRRRWHTRVFTGCGNCRRRHVKCDEQVPSCGNCRRMAAACDYSRDADAASQTAGGGGSGGRFHFRAVQPVAKHRGSSPTAIPQSACPNEQDRRHTENAPSIFPQSSPASTPITAGLLLDNDALYFDHFLGAVSTILIVFDTPTNANPFRKLPHLADSSSSSSGLLEGTMLALGAMHLAQLPAAAAADRSRHYCAAMTAYGSVMARLRGALEAAEDAAGGDVSIAASSPAPLRLLATTLLLCLFEMMHGGDAAWQVHLGGARRIVEAMYSPRVAVAAAQAARPVTGDDYSDYNGGADLVLPMRRFLISLLAYLDVAGACATGEGTLIPGSYWETLGGGWEFNLGSPSFRSAEAGSSSGLAAMAKADRELAQLRQAWSRLMLIQSDISALAKLSRTNGGASSAEFSIRRDAIARRIADWHASAPAFFARLSVASGFHEDAHHAPALARERERELLTGTACVVSYALGCYIYLDRVASRQLRRAADSPAVAAAVDRILALSAYCASELHRMGHLWALFTAGTAAATEQHKATLRGILAGLQRFGFKNVTRSSDILEYVWLQQRLFGEANYNAFDKLVASTLIP